MTIEEIDILNEVEVRGAIERNIERDPLQIALDKGVPHASLVATQVKYLQRARRKLPEYYAARAILPPLAFEQSSSEASACLRRYSGDLCIDLTCGLGVDSLWLSKNFGRVVSIEADGVTAAAARENFSRLGAHNIEVVHSTAEEYMQAFESGGVKADMIYADPDRRGRCGEKLVRLEDCSPDMVSLMPTLHRLARRVVVKASPMFDVAEAFRLFGERCRVEVVSVGGECKEVIVELADDIPEPALRAVAAGIGEFEQRVAALCPMDGDVCFEPPYGFLFVPDVSLRKSRLTGAYVSQVLPGAYICAPDGYALMDTLPGDAGLMGRLFAIAFMEEYSPKRQRRRLAGAGIRRADIYVNNFPQTAPKISRALGIQEGGQQKIAFTETDGRLWYIELKDIYLQ